jgi:TonB family protein
MYDTDNEGYYRYRERRFSWLGYAAAFVVGVFVGALLFSRGCLCAPEEEKPEETAATAEAVAADAETAEEVPATPETAATAGEDVIVFEVPARAPASPAAPAPPAAPTPAPPRKARPRPAEKGLTADEINRTITKRRAGIQSEYNSLLKKNPTLGGGKISVRFTISSGGDVTSAEVVEDTLGSPELAAAIVRRVRTWKFPRARGESTVVYPFVFVAGGT